MKFLAIFDGENFNASNFGDALIITVISMFLTFIILIIILLTIKMLNLVNKKESNNNQNVVVKSNSFTKSKSKLLAFEEMDDDMRAAVLVATIDYKTETNGDARLVSIKQIHQERDKT